MKYIHGHTFLAMMPQKWIAYKSKGRPDFSQLNNKTNRPNWLQYTETVNFTGNSLYYTFAQASTFCTMFCKNKVCLGKCFMSHIASVIMDFWWAFFTIFWDFIIQTVIWGNDLQSQHFSLHMPDSLHCICTFVKWNIFRPTLSFSAF